jgi:hypothetical protein
MVDAATRPEEHNPEYLLPTIVFVQSDYKLELKDQELQIDLC